MASDLAGMTNGERAEDLLLNLARLHYGGGDPFGNKALVMKALADAEARAVKPWREALRRLLPDCSACGGRGYEELLGGPKPNRSCWKCSEARNLLNNKE